ncbi:MAG: hypothetical protein DRH44_07600, partial [Candidatus Coatesbacteria bacterium]
IEVLYEQGVLSEEEVMSLMEEYGVLGDEGRAVYYDQVYRVFWGSGMGADDRAGIIVILELLRKGHRPHVLFTNGEESGCWGAEVAARDLAVYSEQFNLVIELDRRGWNDAVYYGCGNREIREWVGEYGWVEDYGTMTDIGVLCPVWDIAGVNLSVGYYHEHTLQEVLKLDELEYTIERVDRMLRDLPDKRLSYEREVIEGYEVVEIDQASVTEEAGKGFKRGVWV